MFCQVREPLHFAGQRPVRPREAKQRYALIDDCAHAAGAAETFDAFRHLVKTCGGISERQHVFAGELAGGAARLQQISLCKALHDHDPVDRFGVVGRTKPQRRTISNDGSNFFIESGCHPAVYRQLAPAHDAALFRRGIVQIGKSYCSFEFVCPLPCQKNPRAVCLMNLDRFVDAIAPGIREKFDNIMLVLHE